MKVLRLIPVFVLALSGVLVTAGSASAAPPPSGHNTYYCDGSNGGVIPPGNYGSMVITGVCYMPAGNINVWGNVTIAPGALLDAVGSGDPASSPVLPATVDIGGNVWVGSGGVFLFGCSPNITCTNPPAITYDHIRGNLTANGAEGVVVHSAAIGGNVSVVGGGGGAAAENCSAVTQPPSTPVPPAPWSEDPTMLFTPVYTDFEDTTIGGNLTVNDLTSCWLGSLRNQVGGTATFVGNTMGDPDAMEVDNNLVNGNMVCFKNTPGTIPGVPQSTGIQFGDGGSAPNIVGGVGLGECGFNVLSLTPAPEALAQDTPPATCTPTTCIPEHIAVSKWSLGTYHGTRTQTGASAVTLSIGTTESGDTLGAEVNNVVFGGSGLTGTATYDPTAMLGSSGEAVAVTTHPNGSESYTAFENCDCTFHGQSGMITLRAYGTASPDGSTWGTFFVTSGGPGAGGLATLAGYGTFSSFGQPAGTLGLVEHLAITGSSTSHHGQNRNGWSRSGPGRR
jgi:hypothetical protein